MAGVADEQLGRVVARLPIGVLIVAREELEVVYANAAGRRMLHPARVRTGAKLPDPWPSFSLQEYASRLFWPSVTQDVEVRPDPTHTYVVSGVSARGGSIATVLIEDVSARERRRRAERDFVANAAHELLTPLTGIISAAHVLEAGAKEIAEDRDRFIDHITNECTRLANIARSLLVLARAQSGEQPPRFDVLRVRELLDGVVATTQAERPIAVEVDCPPHATVLADRDLFALAFTNLLFNTLRHGPGRGIRISVDARDVQSVRIDVVDAGSKADPAQLARAADRFYTSGGPDAGGFGLGLSIATQSIEALGGTLRFGLEEGIGLIARIDIPSGRASQT